MKPMITSLLLLTALAGCTAVWDASYNKIAASADMIQYEYELLSVNRSGMDEAAQKHCAQFQRKAVLAATELGGYEYINTYRCRPAMDEYSVQPL